MSSDSEDEEYGLTSVLLGYAGRELKALDPLDNHIGGSACWFADTPAPEKFYKCDSCSGSMDLLAQMSCPINDKFYDRVIYIFACTNTSCRRKSGTVKAIRGVQKTPEVEKRIKEQESADSEVEVPQKAKIENLGNKLFENTGTSNPFAAASSNPFASSSAKETEPSSVSKKQANTESTHTKRPVGSTKFTCKAIEVEEEYLSPETIPENVQVVDDEDQGDEGTGASERSEAEMVEFEKTLSAMNDPVFMHFVSIVRSNPDQILRYDLPLKPVPYLKDEIYSILIDPTKIPKLNGHSRAPEVQLMPKLISELETPDMLLDGMEWGTIVVATAADDVLPELDNNGVGYIEEWVGVQWEDMRNE